MCSSDLSDFGGETKNLRTAVCTRSDGRLMFVMMGKVDIGPFATGLVHMGCLTAMQLDQNGTWPFFATFKGLGTTERKAVLLDQRMIRGERVLGASRKDFIALFAPDLLKPGVLG